VNCDASRALSGVKSIRIRPETVYAWHGQSFLITNNRGECASDQPLSGFYFRETRYLRTLRLAINDEYPWLCDVAAPSPDVLDLTFIYPEVFEYGGGGSGSSLGELPANARGIPSRSVDIRLRYQVGVASLDVSLRLANHSRAQVDLDVTWALGADYAGLTEANSNDRQQEAPVDGDADAQGVCYSYTHPELPYRTRVSGAGPGEWHTAFDRIGARLHLAPRDDAELSLHVEPVDYEPQPDADGIARREQRLRDWVSGFARVEVPRNRVAERIIGRAVADLASFPLLDGEEDEWLAVQAGMPLYPALFGRDSATTTWQAAMLDRGEALDDVLTRLGRLQGARVDDWSDEQPGRIVQSVRREPVARLGKNPFSRYYGDYASPLMYVISIAQLYAWTGEKQCIARHRDTARRVLDWAREYGDADGDGYLEYRSRSTDGAKNQGWKDSGNGIVYDDGRIVPDPIATCELQGYWFAAQQLWAVLSWVLGEREDAKALWSSSMDLKARFNRDWWMPAERFFALALDPEKRPVTSITSNVGQCIATGIIDDEHLPPVVDRLFAPDMFSGWGIRTLSAAHVSYNPLKYHLGSVWPVENATIAFGLRRYGFDQRALEIADGTFDLAQSYGDCRAPECVGGYRRWEVSHPGTYPQANSPQAWNQSGIVLLVQTLLGLQPVAALDLLVVDPVLPDWLPEVIVRGLRVGGATATIRFHRGDDGKAHVDVLEKRGTLRVIRQPPPESLDATIRDRFTALVDGILPH
jgi:glycogen debranching enzyme